MRTGSEGRRLAIVDVFRAFCILSVAVFHYTVRWQPPLFDYNLSGNTEIFSHRLMLGRLGVQVFFVISGLVIAMTLERSQSTIHFAIKRFARLYGAFLACATITFLVSRVSGIPHFNVTTIDYLKNISLYSLFLPGKKFVDGAYWSLFVEVNFYVIAAILWATLGSKLWIGLLAVALVGAIWPANDLLQNIPYFLAGVGLYKWFFDSNRGLAAFLIVSALILSIFANREFTHVDHAAIWLGVLAMGAGLQWCPTLALGPMARLGEMSYAMYLIHQNVGVTLMHWVSQYAHVPDILKISLTIVVMYAIASFITDYIEQPSRRYLTKRLEKAFGLTRPTLAKVPAVAKMIAIPQPANDERV